MEPGSPRPVVATVRRHGPVMVASDRPLCKPRLEREPDPAERVEIVDRWRNRRQSLLFIATRLNLRYATVARIVGEPL